MEFIISELQTEDSFEGQAIRSLKDVLKETDGFCFYNPPILEIDEAELEKHSFLILSPIFGILIIDAIHDEISAISKDKMDRIFSDGDAKRYKVLAKIVNSKELRDCKDERLKVENIIYSPHFFYFNREQAFKLFPENIDKIIFSNTVLNFIDNLKTKFNKAIDKKIWNILINEISGISAVIKKRVRSVDTSKRKAFVISEVEKQIQDLDIDPEQIKVGQQIPPGPQRIRGLAGTGKTIILSMKAAYLHFYYPEWNIVYTFNTQSLYDYIKNLIAKFYKYFSGGSEPNWEQIKIMHGWGGTWKEGLYSYIANLLGEKPKTFLEARNLIEHKNNIELLGKLCANILGKYQVPEMFDAILIDEAQDFHKGFYQFAYKLLKKPKRLVWAYDELQSLEEVTIPTTKEIFGEDGSGLPLVNLDDVYPGGIEKDIVLNRAYRNPRVILMLAHFYGMGIFRKEGPIQFLPNKESWEDLGYSIDGEWKTGNKVKIKRPEKNSPNLIEKYTDHREIVNVKMFDAKEDEIIWVANSIKENIDEDILPEEILVIGLGFKKSFDTLRSLQLSLNELGINAIITGRDVKRDIFKAPGHVTISTVFRAKGNEAQVVYVLNFEESEIEDRIIQARDMAFTSMTRTKGWLYITGIGPVMKELFEEIENILNMYPELVFRIPDISKIRRHLDNIEYEKRRKRIEKSVDKLRESLSMIEKAKGAKDLPKDIVEKMKKTVKDAEEINKDGTR